MGMEERSERKEEQPTCPAYRSIGIKTEIKGNKKLAVLKIEEKHLGEAEIEGRKVATGGFAFTVGVAAMSWEVNRFLSNTGKKAVIGTAKIRLENPAEEGDVLRAEGKITKRKGRKISTKTTVFNQNKETVAKLRGKFIILKEQKVKEREK